jgi:hypothetical protein
VGVVDSLRHLMGQATVQDDDEELEEAVDNALKARAGKGGGVRASRALGRPRFLGHG